MLKLQVTSRYLNINWRLIKNTTGKPSFSHLQACSNSFIWKYIFSMLFPNEESVLQQKSGA